MNGNAGEAAKILGAVFGAASATSKASIGIGLYFLDSGMSYQSLMNLALTAKLGAGFSNDAEIQLLYQNLFGHSATSAEVAALGSYITSGQFSQASFATMAADTTNNAANIDLVGLGKTGIAYTPYHI